MFDAFLAVYQNVLICLSVYQLHQLLFHFAETRRCKASDPSFARAEYAAKQVQAVSVAESLCTDLSILSFSA